MRRALHYAVSLHDVAPDTWPDCAQLLALCDAARIPVTLLVVPRYHHGTAVDESPSFAAALQARRARGDDVVLHGYFHVDDGPPARGPLDSRRRSLQTLDTLTAIRLSTPENCTKEPGSWVASMRFGEITSGMPLISPR